MKKAFKTAMTVMVCLTFLALLVPSGWAGSFQNGDFETGDFQGWSGDLVTSGIVDPDSDAHFSIRNFGRFSFSRR